MNDEPLYVFRSFISACEKTRAISAADSYQQKSDKEY